MKWVKKITDKQLLFIVTVCILSIMFFVKTICFYLSSYNIIKSIDDINPAYVLYVSVPFLIFLYIKNLIKTKRKLNLYDYIFYLLIITSIIASVFAIDIKMSFFGKSYRHEGFFSLISYYLLFINWKIYGDKEYIKKIINFFIIIAVINSLYALLQIYTSFNFIFRFFKDNQMAIGLCGNPNFFGSLIVTVQSIVITKFLIDEKFDIKNILIIILFSVSIFNSQSTGPFLACVITVLFLILYLFIKKKLLIKKTIYIILILLVTFLTTDFINKKIYNINKCEMCDAVLTINNSVIKNKVNDANYNNYTITNGRIEIWKKSLDIVKNNFINGVGYDNFYLAYYRGINLSAVVFVSVDGVTKPVLKYSEIVDNAHNVYLHTLISSGILGLIPYLILCLITFIKGLKAKSDLIMLLLGGFVAYSIQAFGNISVIHVAPIYYIIIGLLLCDLNDKNEVKK